MSVRPLPKHLQEKAENELNEIPSRTPDDINHIREWLSKQPHLIARTDDQWLLSFLRGCKFSLQKTKDKLEFYYVMRSLSPEFFTNRDASRPEMKAFFEQRTMTSLPSDSLLSPWRIMIRSKNANPEIANVTVAFKVMFMIWSILTYEDDSFVINGQEVIMDLGSLHYGYVPQLPPTVIKKFANLMFHAFPSRLKCMYFINVPVFFHAVLSVFLSLLSEKIRSRIRIFSENETASLHELIPQSVLPEEYGGHAGPFIELAKKFQLTLEDHYTWFLEDSKYGCDETKRYQVSEWILDYTCGMEGSFRKLDVD